MDGVDHVRPRKLWRFRCVLFVDFVVGLACGWFGAGIWETKPEWYPSHALELYVAMECAGFLLSFVAVITCDIAWGTPEMGPFRSRLCVDILACLWIVVFSVPCGILARFMPQALREVGETLLAIFGLATVLTGIRGWPLQLGSVLAIVGAVVHEPFSLTFVKIGLVWFLSSWTRYLHDQRLASCVLGQPIASSAFGHYLGLMTSLKKGLQQPAFVTGGLGLLIFYLNMMLHRRGRQFPPGLQQVKFIRLGYLRKMMMRGEKIQRCQDLPADAFADWSKTTHLICVSHRWLDPRTSDMHTEECPLGLKREALIKRLEEHFAPRLRRADLASPRHFLHRLYTVACIGGFDVAVFLDFMSLPQEGVDDEGVLIPRTPEEQVVFDECLPNMGTLYSLFPVLVLSEVPPGNGDHLYKESGWCTCEFIIALLARQLRIFSAKSIEIHGRRTQHMARMQHMSLQNMSSKEVDRFKELAHSQLANMHFSRESDRAVAKGIIQAFLERRWLADSIRKRDLLEVLRGLERLHKKGLAATINEPLDCYFNTLLHVAVQAGNADAAEALLLHGAIPHLRNIRGDLPTQLLVLPRFGAAAGVCRSAERGQRPRNFSPPQMRHSSSGTGDMDFTFSMSSN